MKTIDLRSDTVTLQPKEMIDAMANAEVGDDVYREDPTINRLEEKAAKLVGKPAALFVLSGVMGNQLAIRSQTHHGDAALVGASSHLYTHETGAIAAFSGVLPVPCSNVDDCIYPEDIEAHTEGPDIHVPPITLLCMENALGNGTVVPLELMKANYAMAKERGWNVHLDGARLFNAALALGKTPAEIAHYTDTVSFCLSKGLSAPVGSILAGPKETIEKARRYRKMIGGGIRQGGYLAAAGIYALDHMVGRLSEDHENARYLADGLSKIPGIELELDKVQINMVFFKINVPNYDAKSLRKYLQKNGVVTLPPEHGQYRFVTHYGITKDDCDTVIHLIKEYLKSKI